MNTIQELIKRRRSQLLIHSYIYYVLDSNLITDHQWQDWANELTKLQQTYPQYCKLNWYDKEFVDWNGSTGCHLPTDGWVKKKALQLYKQHHET